MHTSVYPPPRRPGARGQRLPSNTLLFQYLLRLAPVLGWPRAGPDLRLAAFGMFNDVSTACARPEAAQVRRRGVDPAFKHLSGGVRFDKVMPDGYNTERGYSAMTPRLILHSSWINREYIMLSYTRYSYGNDVRPSRPTMNSRMPIRTCSSSPLPSSF